MTTSATTTPSRLRTYLANQAFGRGAAAPAHTLTVLTRLAKRRPEEGLRFLERALTGRFDALVKTALDVAIECGHPLGQALANHAWLEASVPQARRLLSLCERPEYHDSIQLRGVRYRAAQKCLEAQETSAGPPRPAQVQDALQLKEVLGTAMGELGQLEECLELLESAAYRCGASEDGSGALVDRAAALLNLGAALNDLGRFEEALEATLEATRLYEQMDPQDVKSELLSCAINRSALHSQLAEWNAALSTGQMAVDQARSMMLRHGSAFLPDLAMALHNLGRSLGEVGRPEDALHMASEATEHYRELASMRPDAFLPGLAMGLNHLAIWSSQLGRQDDALAAAHEAVGTFRTLADEQPAAFRPDLAESLHNLALVHHARGDSSKAFPAAEEAVRLLMPFHLWFSGTFAARMRKFVRSYRRLSTIAGEPVDEDLLDLLAQSAMPSTDPA